MRLLDRAVGIPIVFALGLLQLRARQFPARIDSIGILETAAIGDTVLLSAVLSDLRDAFPGAQIVLFAGDSNVEVARLLSGVDSVVRLPVRHLRQACRTVRGQWFDLFVDFGPWPRVNAIISFCARAAYKIGFHTPGQFRHYIYDYSVLHSRDQHELENFRDVARAIHVRPTHRPSIPSRAHAAAVPLKYLPARDYAVFHLWPGGYRAYLKEWPVEYWLELALALADLKLDIALTGAPSDHAGNEKVISLALRKSTQQNWTNCAGASIEETLTILQRSRLTVSVNTGIMHLAAVTDVPVVGLHGPTSAQRWGPVGDFALAVTPPGHDCGYLDLGFEYPRRCDCMRRITVGQVLQACQWLLDSRFASSEFVSLSKEASARRT